MGQMRLVVHDRERIPPGGLEQVHMCGPDDLPWFGRAFFSGNQLIVERNESDSGRVFVPWRIEDTGHLLVGTSTLMERDRPYLLEVELARGMVNLLRNQMAQWEMMGLAVPEVTFWTIGDADGLHGCVALKEVGPEHGELKSMRTDAAARGRGLGARLLEHVLAESARRGYRRVSLETGSQEFFRPARTLYAKYGFEECGPFGDYVLDPNSVFMTLELDPVEASR